MKIRAGLALILAGLGMGLSRASDASECGAWVDKAYVHNNYHGAFGFAPHVTFFVKVDREELGLTEISRIVFKGVKIHRNDQTGVVGPVKPYETELRSFAGSLNYFETSFDDIQPAFWNHYQHATYEGLFYVEGATGERVEVSSSIGQFYVDLRFAFDLERAGQFAGRPRIDPRYGHDRRLDVGALQKTADYPDPGLSHYLNPRRCR